MVGCEAPLPQNALIPTYHGLGIALRPVFGGYYALLMESIYLANTSMKCILEYSSAQRLFYLSRVITLTTTPEGTLCSDLDSPVWSVDQRL